MIGYNNILVLTFTLGLTVTFGHVHSEEPEESKMDQPTDFMFVDEATYYGKNGVKILTLDRDGSTHYIRELEVSVHLGLSSRQEFMNGDNGDVIATDTQKNAIYALAKAKGIKSAEGFGLDLCQHFLATYQQVASVRVHIEEAPWTRMSGNHGNTLRREHNHAFIITQQAVRFADVFQERYETATVWGGLKDMKILKTTQSGFEGFLRDEYTTLSDAKDRILSTNVFCKWLYTTPESTQNFDRVWHTVKDIILDVFAGPPDNGTYSLSVQYTVYRIEKRILNHISLIERVDVEAPNIHYILANLGKIGMKNDKPYQIFVPHDKPYGLIRSALKRRITKP